MAATHRSSCAGASVAGTIAVSRTYEEPNQTRCAAYWRRGEGSEGRARASGDCRLVRRECARVFFFFQAEDGIRDPLVTGVQTCALPISADSSADEGNCWFG